MALAIHKVSNHNQAGGLFHLILSNYSDKELQMAAKGWIQVSDNYCKGCELCIPVCPQGVMELDTTRLTPKGYHPAHTFKDGCTGCAICAIVCPDAAITVYREITKAVPAPA